VGSYRTNHNCRVNYNEFQRVYISKGDLGEHNPRNTYLRYFGLSKSTILEHADLTATNLSRADFSYADLRKADLRDSYLKRTLMVETNLEGANLSGASIYGISVWNINLKGAIQSNLVVTSDDEPRITVDNMEVAQFIHLLLNNKNIRDVIDTVAKKTVLILGRFAPTRKRILDELRDALRKYDFIPILFDFERLSSRNITETASTLAHMARFVIADLTDAKSIPQELQRIVPSLPSVPVQPLILSSQYEYSMFKDFLDYPWVLEPYRYDNLESLINSLEKVIAPSVAKAKAIEEKRKASEVEISK
jgi:Pentapeptide repeats (8 copies)